MGGAGDNGESDSAVFVEGEPLPDTTLPWPGPGGPWLLTLRWQVINSRPECIGLCLTATSDSGKSAATETVRVPLTSGILRDLKLGERIREQRAAIVAEAGNPLPANVSTIRRSTRRRLLEAATVYREAYGRGDRPVKAVAEHFGISQGGASNLVARARAVGLLPPTSPGAPQG